MRLGSERMQAFTLLVFAFIYLISSVTWLFFWSNNAESLEYGSIPVALTTVTIIVATFMLVTQYNRFRRARR